MKRAGARPPHGRRERSRRERRRLALPLDRNEARASLIGTNFLFAITSSPAFFKALSSASPMPPEVAHGREAPPRRRCAPDRPAALARVPEPARREGRGQLRRWHPTARRGRARPDHGRQRTSVARRATPPRTGAGPRNAGASYVDQVDQDLFRRPPICTVVLQSEGVVTPFFLRMTHKKKEEREKKKRACLFGFISCRCGRARFRARNHGKPHAGTARPGSKPSRERVVEI